MNTNMTQIARSIRLLAGVSLAIAASAANAQSVGFVPLVSLGQEVGGFQVGGPWGDLLTASDGTFYSPFGYPIPGWSNAAGYFVMTSTGSLSRLTMVEGVSSQYFNSLMQSSDSNFYGSSLYDYGSVFMATSAGGWNWLSQLGPGNGDPIGALVQGTDGALYGVTHGDTGGGMVFRATTTNQWSMLHQFTDLNAAGINSDGGAPLAGLALGPDGNFYGTASKGGAHGLGTVFRITSTGVLTTLHSFAGTDGATPGARLTLANDGQLYGTTENGGADGDGSIFRIALDGTGFSTLHSFARTDGMTPASGLVQLVKGTNTYLYGTTKSGGYGNTGTLFSITTAGNFSSLYSFSATSNGTNNDGAAPNGMSLGLDGNLYGTASLGGSLGMGTGFELIVQKPTVTIQVNPKTVSPYQNSTLIWSSTSATSCEASGAWSGAEPPTGTQTVSQQSAGTYYYKLTCKGPLGQVTKKATLTVK